MESKKVLAVLLRMSWIIVITVLIGVGVGILLTRWLPHEYTAKTRLFVSTTGGTSSTESYQGDQFSQQRAASYAQIVTSEQVAQKSSTSSGCKCPLANSRRKSGPSLCPGRCSSTSR